MSEGIKKMTREETFMAEKLARRHLRQLHLSEDQVNTVLGWMVEGDGLPLVRFGLFMEVVVPRFENREAQGGRYGRY